MSAPVTVAPDLVAVLRARVSDRLAGHGAQLPDAQRRAVIAGYIAEELLAYAGEIITAGRTPLSRHVEAALARAVRDSFLGLGGLQPLLDDERVEDIFANGCDNVWIRTTDGQVSRVPPVAATDDELVDLVRTAAARSGQEERRFDRGSPGLSLRLPGGQRLFAVMAVSKRPSVSIRRNVLRQVTLDDLVARGELTPGLRDLIQAMVRARKNLVICGGTGAGKTTLLRAAAAAISPSERIVTVEDAFELGLDEDTDAHPNTTALQQREPNLEGAGGIDMATMVTWGLRMRPDRVIVGESRGAEAVPMLLAMSQGNDGSMCTVHASSSKQALTRLAMYVMQAPEKLGFDAANVLIGQAVDFVLHLDVATDGTRVLSSVRQVLETDGTQVPSNEIYRPGPDRRAVPGAPLRADTLDDLIAAGLHPDALTRERW
ncbi:MULTISPECIES: ATPase, T2SS/T4P/T4SS family [unclassified Micromonospora]|uniref:CpaF family protein n=1 Tax=unclassified Micromonospora TaxID=2617518 RepID=UPI001C243D80|nr:MULTISPECIES: ATPase, T2SS/T4P/T4SS family [unclassified Micromonospora]MBU8857780.1 Flp pilus assembly complex ATPase component TadA [Micromonospora sp. WMMB482]MDM4783409.1 ATPase, T2SS/T4P/T4SS family [Micromonospora sp. b486]